ncbi:serine/threonine-protein kinase [Streptomyces ziwulingensis]|uniref:non-specific serine/threonine protein kinase n=1 Tax=Streptomyces ziwulingensis TaxID=1045501 RepID=A0ABP9CG44_9ACTN
MSSNGGAPRRADEPTSFGLRPPSPRAAVPYPGNPYATPAQVVPEPSPAVEQGAGRLVAGRYRLIAKLGHGGMGTVWRARDETVDREVAVKEPRLPDHLPERERDTVFERMRREARAAARLDHPAVVDVYDVAVVDGRPWIVMELVRGRSLGDALQEGTLGVREAARIGREVLGALEAAHAAGVLHRDVKPDNVLLGRYDRVVLTDFGIARIEGETDLTDTGGFVGSPEFIAPERVLGRRPGPESDLWSLGVVLYAATEGVSPFRRGNTAATLQSVLNSTPAPPAAGGPLGEAITGLLHKDPAHRPDAARVRALLDAAAEPPAPTPPAWAAVGDSVGDAGPAGRRVRFGRAARAALAAAVAAAAVAAYLVLADPFAGPLPQGWEKHREKNLAATVAAPPGYQRTVSTEADEHWVGYADPSGAVWLRLALSRKAEDELHHIAGSAAAEMYDDDGEFKTSGDYDLSMPETVRTDPEQTEYRGRKAAENTLVYTTTDTQNPLPREVRIFYFRTAGGDLYELTAGYPGKGDFTARGREVARTAIDNLDLDAL